MSYTNETTENTSEMPMNSNDANNSKNIYTILMFMKCVAENEGLLPEGISEYELNRIKDQFRAGNYEIVMQHDNMLEAEENEFKFVDYFE